MEWNFSYVCIILILNTSLVQFASIREHSQAVEAILLWFSWSFCRVPVFPGGGGGGGSTNGSTDVVSEPQNLLYIVVSVFFLVLMAYSIICLSLYVRAPPFLNSLTRRTCKNCTVRLACLSRPLILMPFEIGFVWFVKWWTQKSMHATAVRCMQFCLAWISTCYNSTYSWSQMGKKRFQKRIFFVLFEMECFIMCSPTFLFYI